MSGTGEDMTLKIGISASPDRDRHPKPALAAVRKAFAETPFPKHLRWPRISVIVCTYNGSRTIRDCLESMLKLEYPDFEVIVVNDGSSDTTAAILQEYPIRVISTENRGLSMARNVGLKAATGEIVAYIDDDAYPTPYWLSYLAAGFLSTTHAAVGGPNIAPSGDGTIADCVADAPGGPIHVLLSDGEAEHIPGCNMAFRKAALQAIGGFDPQFRTAGDDVDICWRVRQQGWTIGFSAAAMVWHHRRNSIRAYWKQQLGYGKAEALLERKWLEKYNGAGHITWAGRIYGKGLTLTLGHTPRIYHGIWGSSPFQSLYQPAPATFWSLSLIPEWYLVIVILTALSALGLLWAPLRLAMPLLVLAVLLTFAQAGLGAARASFSHASRCGKFPLKHYVLTAGLYLLQPMARLCGRLSGGLLPWRQYGARRWTFPWLRKFSLWSERGQPLLERIQSFEQNLQADGAYVLRGSEYDRWDLEVRGGNLGGVRTRMVIEEHGAGKQLLRLRLWPRASSLGLTLTLLFTVLASAAAFNQVWPVYLPLGTVVILLFLSIFQDCASATSTVLFVCQTMVEKDETIRKLDST